MAKPNDVIVFEVWECLGNSDQTEGKGRMVPRRRFDSEAAAVAWASSDEGRRECGVMGCGYGEVQKVAYWSNTESSTGGLVITTEKVWGYRKAPWKTAWDYGYIDMRDEPSADPDYQTYLRLKNRFQGE